MDYLSPSKSPSARESSPQEASETSRGSRFGFDFDLFRRNKEANNSKRRGPKPDAKPPLTRKQELNRQAQRTHRERKERYVRTIEEEIDRLRQSFTKILKERDQVLEENRRLKELLALHNIAFDIENQHGNQFAPSPAASENNQMAGHGPTMDYDEIGIGFVLALERPCMDHIKKLTSNALNDREVECHGHSLCVSCPPENHSYRHPGEDWDPRSRKVQVADLSILFNLSNRLQLDGEMTPIAVWATITRHERFPELNHVDFETLKQELLSKVKCHGFGAVIEEYEVHDALAGFFGAKAGN